MARKKVTSSDVAEKAGVSQATVSMVLNHKYNVSFSRETVEKVESAARELGYQLPGHKNKKENKKEKMIVVFCPTITSPYYVMLLQGIIYACNPHPDYISQVEEMARSIPLVIISNKEKISTVDAINQDNTEVGRLMARHLLDLGHRDVAFITPPLTRRQWQRSKRVDGFVREFEKAGLSGHVIIRAADESVDRRNPKTDSEYSMGYALTRSLLEDGSRFTAIAGQNDMMAIGAVDALQDARLRVPKDVSVIGCDNIFYSGIRRVSLTTIDHFVDLKGRDACDIIIRKIDTGIRFGEGIRPTSVYNIEYNPKIIVRKTTGYARMDKPDPINEKSEENKFK